MIHKKLLSDARERKSTFHQKSNSWLFRNLFNVKKILIFCQTTIDLLIKIQVSGPKAKKWVPLAVVKSSIEKCQKMTVFSLIFHTLNVNLKMWYSKKSMLHIFFWFRDHFDVGSKGRAAHSQILVFLTFKVKFSVDLHICINVFIYWITLLSNQALLRVMNFMHVLAQKMYTHILLGNSIKS